MLQDPQPHILADPLNSVITVKQDGVVLQAPILGEYIGVGSRLDSLRLGIEKKS